jgi:hypothetical protein
VQSIDDGLRDDACLKRCRVLSLTALEMANEDEQSRGPDAECQRREENDSQDQTGRTLAKRCSAA